MQHVADKSLKVMYTNPRSVVAKAGMKRACLPRILSAKAPYKATSQLTFPRAMAALRFHQFHPVGQIQSTGAGTSYSDAAFAIYGTENRAQNKEDPHRKKHQKFPQVNTTFCLLQGEDEWCHDWPLSVSCNVLLNSFACNLVPCRYHKQYLSKCMRSHQKSKCARIYAS